MSYECENIDLFNELENLEFFEQFIKHQYKNVCFSGTRLKASISEYNLTEAFASYMKDKNELKEKENAGKPLLRIKKAAFMCYWLRRVSPITGIYSSLNLMNDNVRSTKENLLIKYANEFCAFDLGYRICRFIEASKKENSDKYLRTSILDNNASSGESGANEYLLRDTRSYIIPQSYIIDMCECLKEKNVSPHSLYLIYKGLFTQLQP